MKEVLKTIFICVSILFTICVLPIMIMNHDFTTVKPGERYLYIRNAENPFEKTVIDTLYVDDVKNDWIKWHRIYTCDVDSQKHTIYDNGRKRFFLDITNGKVK